MIAAVVSPCGGAAHFLFAGGDFDRGGAHERGVDGAARLELLHQLRFLLGVGAGQRQMDTHGLHAWIKRLALEPARIEVALHDGGRAFQRNLQLGRGGLRDKDAAGAQ